jgi:hypothetical protein
LETTLFPQHRTGAAGDRLCYEAPPVERLARIRDKRRAALHAPAVGGKPLDAEPVNG